MAVDASRQVVCVPTKVFYCNGMTTTKKEARKRCDELEAITQSDVELVHNNALPGVDLVMMAVKAALVFFCAKMALESYKKKERALAASLAAAAVGLATAMALEYEAVQDKKNQRAERLAKKVRAHLEQNPGAHVALVFHSQGADVGKRALKLLADQKDRLRVATLGGMVNIPSSLAHRVVNFHNWKDLVSRVAKGFFGNLSEAVDPQLGSSRVVETSGGDCLVCHDASDYLNTGMIKRAIRQLAAPNCFAMPS